MSLMLKNLMSGGAAAEHLLHDFQGVGALHLKAVGQADSLAFGGTLVARGFSFVSAGFDVILHPIGRGRASHQVEIIFTKVEQDGVADDVAVGSAADELLGLVDFEILEAVDAEVGEDLQSVGAFHVQIRHVVRLIEERAAVAPGLLFISPVGEFMLHHWKGIGSDLRIPQHFNRIPGCL